MFKHLNFMGMFNPVSPTKYDGTWKAAPQLWEAVADAIKDNGDSCICITSREKDTKDKELEKSIGKHMSIVYANGKPKEKIAKDKGYTVKVWIDDKPETIKPKTSKRTNNIKPEKKTMSELGANEYLDRLSELNKREKKIEELIEGWQNLSPSTDKAIKEKWEQIDDLNGCLSRLSNDRWDLERQREKSGISQFC